MSERKITQIFLRSHAKAKATSATDRSGTILLRQGFDLMEKSERQVAPQTLVLGAEAAVANLAFGDAQRMTRQYFLREPARDQFYCRALFVHALEEAKESRRLCGMAAVNQLQNSISFIDRVLDIALLPANEEQYAFLVYNASVHLWNICRPLMRDGARKYYAPPFARIVDGLEQVGELDVKWRVKLIIALATAYIDMPEMSDAAQQALSKAIGMLRGMALDEDTIALRAHVRQLVLHVADGAGGGSKGALVDEIATGMDDGHTPALLVAVDRELQNVRSDRIPVEGEADAINAILDSLDAIIASIHHAAAHSGSHSPTRGGGQAAGEGEDGAAGGSSEAEKLSGDGVDVSGDTDHHGGQSLDVVGLERVLER